MDIVTILMFSTTILLLNDQRIGIFCLFFLNLAEFFSNSGPLSYMQGQDFFIRHIVEEVCLASLALWCIGRNWRGYSLAGLCAITAGYYLYEYLMWYNLTNTFKHYELINQGFFIIIIGVLWIKSPLRNYGITKKCSLKLQKSFNQIRRYCTSESVD